MTGDVEINYRWGQLMKKLEPITGDKPEIEGILLLIGIQEIGKGPMKLNKNQKLEVLHVAVCRLLSDYGYYDYVGNDADGCPHYEPTEKLPHLKPMQQHKLIKEAILNYFDLIFD
jgi:hypothetical protein